MHSQNKVLQAQLKSTEEAVSHVQNQQVLLGGKLQSMNPTKFYRGESQHLKRESSQVKNKIVDNSFYLGHQPQKLSSKSPELHAHQHPTLFRNTRNGEAYQSQERRHFLGPEQASRTHSQSIDAHSQNHKSAFVQSHSAKKP